MSRISEYTPVTSGSSAASGDIMLLVDVSDTSGGTAGTTKNATISHLASTFFTLGLGAGISALPTMGATGIAYAVGISGSTPYKVPRADLVFDKEELFIAAEAEGTLTTTDPGDYFIVYDDSSTAGHKVKKISASFLEKTIEDFFDEAALAGSLTASTTTTAGSVSESDWYIIYDASTSTVKKILKSDTVNLSLAINALSASPPTALIPTDYVPVYSATGLAYKTEVSTVFNTGYTTIYKGLTSSTHPIAVIPASGTTATAYSWVTVGGTTGTATRNARTTVKSGTGSIEFTTSGTGALYAESAASSTAGLLRGSYAVDLQLAKTSATCIAQGAYSALLGGYNNVASGSYAVVLGGSGGTAGSTGVAILGGLNNYATGAYSAIVAGATSTVISDYSVVVGGGGNNVRQANSAVVGGFNNLILSQYSAIVGGVANQCTTGADYSSILGGANNQTFGDNNIVAGGENNIASGLDSAVLGGSVNQSSGDYSGILGGSSHLTPGTRAAVVGGYDHSAAADRSVILGGDANYTLVGAINSAVLGGAGNNTEASAINSVVLGGTGQAVSRENTAHAVNLHAARAFSLSTTAEAAGAATVNNAVYTQPVITRNATATLLTITGITGGWDGRQITFLQFGLAGTLTFANNSASSAAGNRLYTATAADVTITGTGAAQFIYSSVAAGWIQAYSTP